ncbi:TRAP transporter large permease [Sulfitobacter pseudonitzschiae]|uniref:TRAP transporter large permease protein n=1 Tax=Pseudosulfitobacter pseudonitzschiae TaxID=1402135 RepID=A0A9Q2RXD3_9RHOB|nr:TRAP transporter large permease [Pseudosulfitobacter pseudonitzschiae]MBM2294829.1 TRAP transporter large permease [Pseudosulfitobacter pseudonitzschiae]MBM2299766.1 TRAP transporter large permease [Pseudosulfitobacter pseudonitzschiae]MBM2304666.1 TRAP transporter large permease [Pseudosulfitobacter pseudonitzschiae]MBM2314439.1 TRAP transporter large permease [Pseudosulfitobacter pseudonitzschiae]MBM2319335.1 TRAP transporter large permease [Pseudosulfitobacter pseudonitzschiae]
MDPLILALLGFCAMMLLIALHVPIGISMALVGVVGFAQVVGWGPALSLMASEPASAMSSLDLAVIPLFMLMGSLAAAGGLATDVYDMAGALFGHRRGGLATTTIVASAGFGAICGSGVATTATFGRVAMPEMLSRNYRPSLASGAIAAGGTLGIIVPPSAMMILYAVLTEQSVLELFSAAIIPAMLAVVFYAVAVQVTVWRDPDAAPKSEKLPLRERLAAIGRAWGVILLAVVVLGGIYSGIFTVNEAAAIGVVIAFFFALMRKRLDRATFLRVMAEASGSTAMIYLMVFGATIFSYFVSVTGGAQFIVSSISESSISPIAVIFCILLLYIFLGAFFDEVAAMVITLPFVIPVIQGFGYDLVWWGIINVVVIGIGMITPPIGINVMLLNSMYRDIRITTIYRGIVPFLVADLVRLIVLVLFPPLTLWLPSVIG